MSVETTCVFCRIVNGEIPSEVVAENDSAIAIRDLSPVAPSHVLLLSRRHLADATALEGEAELLGALFSLANEVARSEELDEKGFRIVTNVGKDGGQTVGHLHFHVLGGRAFSWPPG